MAASGHLLVTGGPGSGKTTISILKADQVIEKDGGPGQQVLFLSFARASVSRTVEAIEFEQTIPLERKRQIRVETYHSFFWRILKAHGYLIGLPRRIEILTPAAEAVRLSDARLNFSTENHDENNGVSREKAIRQRLAIDEGRVCFDLFALFVGEILHGSERLRRLVATRFPAVVIDEFQDTNEEQWRVLQALGSVCRLIALADPEQRIYDWIGADPARLDQFRDAFSPKELQLGADNHRSSGTEIVEFGNDVLSGTFRRTKYRGVSCESFEPFQTRAMAKLITTIYAARRRLIKARPAGWSLAILVPTKKMTRLVSDALRAPPAGMDDIAHSAVIDMEGPILAAEVIAFLLQPGTGDRHCSQFIQLVCDYFHGKNGSRPTQAAFNQAANIRKAHENWMARRSGGKAIRKGSVLVSMLEVYERTRHLGLSGDPSRDWRSMRSVLELGACRRLNDIAQAVRSIRILSRGTLLRRELSEDWRNNGGYINARAIVERAFVQQHFSTSVNPEDGVVVMNMHKAKGKQFDEVIIFEGWPRKQGQGIYNPDRIVRSNSKACIDSQARQNLRVSLTRARTMTTILTPSTDPCVLLIPA